MDALESANRRAPRPMVWGAAAGSVPEEFAKLSDTPVGTPESMYRQMQQTPEGLLGGQMAPQGFAVEEVTVQPIPPRDVQDVGAYMRSSVRDRVKRGQDLDARMMAEKRRIRNALAR